MSSDEPIPYNIRDLIGLKPSSDELSRYISALTKSVITPNSGTPQTKSYPDAVYLNYFSLGLSLLFTPSPPYKPEIGLNFFELNNDKLVLESIDIYNIPKHSPSDPKAKGTSSRKAELAFSTFPVSPFVLTTATQRDLKEGRFDFDITPETSGKDFVQILGEPDRKGGGAGPSSGSIGIWCEWSKDGIMIEFGGDEAKGPQAWERGKDAVWKVITLFLPAIPTK